MSLEKELEGVTAPDIDSPDDVIDDDATDAAVVAGNDDDDPSDGGGTPGAAAKDDRPVENVRRELLRKHDEESRRTRSEIAQLTQLVQAALGAVSAKPTPKSADDFTIEDMDAMRAAVTPEQKPAFDALYTQKLVARHVQSQFSTVQEAEKYQRERDRAKVHAVERYPQLLDSFSPLHAEVNRRLMASDQNVIKYNTRIVLNLAEEVASEMGIKPRLVTRSRATVTRPDSTNGRKPVINAQAAESVIPNEEFDRLASKLLVGKVKNDEETRKRVKERGKQYAADPRFGGKE